MTSLEAEGRSDIFVAHAFPEQTVDVGEVRLNYATAGSGDKPAILLIPAQTESWWGYERAMPLLAEHFQVYAVDLRGQGRSTWTPGRYTLDNLGNDLVRFIDQVIGRPALVSGNSSGGVLAAWLAAYARPGQVRAAVLEDAPVFASELITSCGQGIRQGLGPVFALWHKWLGSQWTIGDWKGMQAALPQETPTWMATALFGMSIKDPSASPPSFDEPPQNMREYDPEWGLAFYSGTATAGCDHARMLSSVKVPVLFTHHFHATDKATGTVMGAVSDQQVDRAGELVNQAGFPFEVASFPGMAHSMHAQDPVLFTETVTSWWQPTRHSGA